MEYISHEDFKGFMNKFQAETPKGLLKESFNFDDEGEEHSLAVEKELEDLFKAGKLDKQTLNNALDYVADNDYELYADNLGVDYVLKQISGVEEGNAFTAGLAKAKKGEKFTVGGKSVKDTSNYDAPIKEASGDIEKLKQEIKTEYGHGGSILSFANPRELARIAKISPKAAKAIEAMNNMMPEDLEIEDLKPALKAKVEKIESSVLKDLGIDLEELDEASYTDNYPGSWGYREGAEEETSDGSHMSNPDTVAKIVAKKHGAELKPLFDKYQASHEQYMQDIRSNKPNQQELAKAHNAIVKAFQNQAINWAGHEMLEAGMNKTKVSNLLSGYGYFEDWLSDYVSAVNKELKGVAEGLNMPPLQATGQTISTVEEEYTADKPFKIPSRRNSAELDYDPQASRFEPDYMKTPGEDDDDDEDNIGIDDEDDLMNLPDIPKNLKQIVAKDKARYPFLREDQAPYGFSVLSPDERKQLREYINSVKTIKQEIAKLLEKAGKSGKIVEDDRKREDEKVPAERKPEYHNPTKKSKPGGNRTGLVMTKAEMWENDKKDSIADSLGDKLQDAFHKVTDMAIKQLMADGFDESMAASYLKSEIEEIAKEAIMSQYDL